MTRQPLAATSRVVDMLTEEGWTADPGHPSTWQYRDGESVYTIHLTVHRGSVACASLWDVTPGQGPELLDTAYAAWTSVHRMEVLRA